MTLETPMPRVLWRSDEALVVVKPAGMSSELPPRDPKSADSTVLAWVRRELGLPEARLPHRLDRITRGLLVIAPDSGAAATLGASLAAGAWRKHYLARIRADRQLEPTELVGVHTLHLRATGRRAEVVRSGGQRAVTSIVAVHPAPGHPDQRHALLRLHTGRFHQVRATLAHLGAPVAGDPIYDGPAGGRAPYLEHILLVLPCGGRDVVLHDADDPERERLSGAMRQEIESLMHPEG